MSYQVLARKWRPKNFSEMAGQAHIVKTLTHALEQNRLHHAYLFSGLHGTGKTSVARIFAKCLSCETGITATPCEKCQSCQEINEGRFLDLIEIDAASRTKVEDTRELLDKIQYAPTRGRFKIYLIDEVHMLSTHSFNALLKTLEEPPEHVKFLLATTEAEKLPVTVLSRCLQFNLKRLSNDVIANHLSKIASQENLPSNTEAMHLLAKAANGSVRDAMSLLDQAIAYTNSTLDENDISDMLGNVKQSLLWDLLTALQQSDSATLFKLCDEIASFAPDYRQLLAGLLNLLYDVAIAQVLPTDSAHPFSDAVLKFSQSLSADKVQQYYQIALMGHRDLISHPDPARGFTMILLQMLTEQTPTATAQTAPTTAQAAPVSSRQTSTKPAPVSTTATTTQTKPAPPAPAAAATTPRSETPPAPATPSSPAPSPRPAPPAPTPAPKTKWDEIIASLDLSGPLLTIAKQCALDKVDDDCIYLHIDPSQQALLNARFKEKLNNALSSHFNKPMKMRVDTGPLETRSPSLVENQHKQAVRDHNKAQLMADENIQELQNLFGATICDDTSEQ